MTLIKPKKTFARVLVTAIDRQTGKTKSRTFYDTTPAKVIADLTRMAGGKPRAQLEASAQG